MFIDMWFGVGAFVLFGGLMGVIGFGFRSSVGVCFMVL